MNDTIEVVITRFAVGDRLIVVLPPNSTHAAADFTRDAVQRFLCDANAKALIVPHGTTVQVLRPEENQT